MFGFGHKLSEHMPELTTTQECDEIFSHEFCIVFKHSPTCMISRLAYGAVARFRSAQPDLPIHLISVRRRRDVSMYVADRTGVEHASPQILVLRRGHVVANASHDEITESWLQHCVENLKIV